MFECIGLESLILGHKKGFSPVNTILSDLGLDLSQVGQQHSILPPHFPPTCPTNTGCPVPVLRNRELILIGSDKFSLFSCTTLCCTA